MRLITVDEWRRLARMSSVHVDEEEVETFIRECEDMYIIPAIGVRLYEDLCAYQENNRVVLWDEVFSREFVAGLYGNKYVEWSEDFSREFVPELNKISSRVCDVLLNGGVWEANGDMKRARGLKTALSYYVYGKMIRNDGAMVSRSGFLQYNDDKAQRVDDKQRVNRYNDVMSLAEMYLSGSLDYIRDEINACVKMVRGKRMTIMAIGD